MQLEEEMAKEVIRQANCLQKQNNHFSDTKFNKEMGISSMHAINLLTSVLVMDF